MNKYLPKRKNPYLAVDVLIIEGGKIVLIKRTKEPWKGKLSLPGGFVEWGETVESAAIREAMEETGLKVKIVKLLGVYSNPKRDPRGHIVSIAFLSKPVGGKLKSSEEGKVKWYKINKKIFKYFHSKSDHRKIIEDFLKQRIKNEKKSFLR